MMRTLPSALLLLVTSCLLNLTAHTDSAKAHGDADHDHAESKPVSKTNFDASRPQRRLDGSLFIPKSLQHQLLVRTQRVRLEEVQSTLELSGKVIPDARGSGRVQATKGGSVLPTENGIPLPGKTVHKGDILAYLSPISGAIERANQLAQAAELEAQIAIVERRVKRYAQLEGAIPQKDIDAAIIDYESLKKRRHLVNAAVNQAEPLIAPTSGILSASYVTAGQVVDAKEVLFDIVDPQHLFVEALAYDTQIAAHLSSASALYEGNTIALKFVGGGAQLRQQALPLLFQITSKESDLAIGQSLRVFVQVASATKAKGFIVKRSGLAKNAAGTAIVWVHTNAETFVEREVRYLPLDANHVAVTNGLQEGERVVVQSANLLSEVR